ncbi:site-specific integrase [Catalinimonas sp. 4WD22]|uniref:site-specific integrase n=1 Tax=Catalinimonas locisalis TaxID=3133978 RepID=UPI0031014D37
MAKETQVKYKVILHKTKTLKDGKHPIVLRLTFRRKRKYYSIGERATENEWIKIKDISSRGSSKKIREKVTETENLAEEVINELEKKDAFTFDAFERAFFTEENHTTVFSFFDQLISQYEQQGRDGNAEVYRGTKNAISRFRNNKDLNFDDINYSFLNNWETFLSKTNSINSISIHMRTLRSTYNKAISCELAKEVNYPFKNYQIQKEATAKRALKKEVIQEVEKLDIKPMSKQWVAQQYFLFSYLCQGMPFSDMAHLKWENIIDGRIVYKRVKTIRTSKNPKTISIKVTHRIDTILNAFRRPNAKFDDYVFPILKKDIQSKTIKNTIKSKRKAFNAQLKILFGRVGVHGKITSYVARHSYGTVLKRNKVPTSIISEGMAHQTEMMTQTYLDSFDNDVVDEANKGLLNESKPWDQQKSKFISNVAFNIDKAIQNKAWTRSKFADEMQVSISLVNNWLSGTYDFTIDVLFDICQVVNIDFATLIKE